MSFSATDSEANTGTAQATVTVVPAAPTGLIAEARNQEVFLDWDDGPAGLTYNVYRSETASGPYTAPIGSGVALSEYLDTGRDNGTTYFYVVTAVDVANNESFNSNGVSATPQDTILPTISATVEPAPNTAGWNNTDVNVAFECTDTGSGIADCLGSQTVTAEGANQSVEGTATDLDGNTATTTVNINIDKTAPTVIITSPAEGAVFPLSETVSAAWAASDDLSGIASESGTADPGSPIDTSTQGLHSLSVTATDLAGNSSDLTHSYTVLAPLAFFEVEKGELDLEQGSETDGFALEGELEPADPGNGIDVANEAVTVTFDGFAETIIAGSFVRNADDDGFEFSGPSGGITQAQFKDDGRFRVRGEGLDLGSIVIGDPVFFSLRIGDEVGRTDISFGEEPFELEAREARELFGTVVSVTVLPDGLGVLVLNTKDGVADVLTDEETQFRLPRNRDAGIEDLVAGDLVAVSLEEEDGVLVAEIVHLVPRKTRHRHVPGEIVSLIDGEQLTIQRPSAGAEQVTFNITDDTRINLRGGIEELTEGLFVVVSAIRDPLTGDLSNDALGINVTRGRPPVVGPKSPRKARPQSARAAEIQGVLGLDALGNWTVNGIVIAIDPDTEIEGGLAVGQSVEIEGVLKKDGTILALEIETEDEDDVVSSRTELKGIFQGIDEETGKWIISGNLVEVGPGTDSDGLPFVGQRVKVEAIVQEDGALLAREIENAGGSEDEDDDSKEVKIDCTFLGVDADGKWIVNGTSVLIDPLTQVKGAPTVGERIKIKGRSKRTASSWRKKLRERDEANPVPAIEPRSGAL